MNTEWKDFLTQQGAKINEGMVESFANTQNCPDTARETLIYDLSHEGLIQARGQDSLTFLQGQLTNDLRQVSEKTHQLNGYCNPKGRLLALFRLFMRDEAYVLQLPSALLESILKRLSMFVLRSDVVLEDISDRLIRFGLSGPNAESLLQQLLGTCPADIDTAVTHNGVTVLRILGEPHRFILYGEAEPMKNLWLELSKAGAEAADNNTQRLLNIRAGLPEVFTETSEAFVPQMLNLQSINGVSFKKGCYTGQEVVARMQYLGKLKRRMYLAHTDAVELPQLGAELNSPDSASGQGAGRIVNVAAACNGGYDLLAVLEISSAENERVYLDEAQKQALQLLPLPYPLE